MAVNVKLSDENKHITINAPASNNAIEFIIDYKSNYDGQATVGHSSGITHQGRWTTVTLDNNAVPTQAGQYALEIHETIQDDAEWSTTNYKWDSPDITWDTIQDAVRDALLHKDVLILTKEISTAAYGGNETTPQEYAGTQLTTAEYSADNSFVDYTGFEDPNANTYSGGNDNKHNTYNG